MRIGTPGVLAVTAFIWVGGLADAVTAVQAPAGRTVWDRVYTDAQAARGKEVFGMFCTRCHGEMLQGETGPALAGDRFMTSFEQDNINRLFTTMRTRMPQNAPGTLTQQNYIDLVAYVLQVNTFPSGADDLPPDPVALRAIRVVPMGGPRPAPNFALIRMVGCLTQAGSAWQLSTASEPMVTRNAAASKDEELADARQMALGTATFSLMTLAVTPAVADAGRKVEAKGLLIRNAQGNRINLTSLQAIGPPCEAR